MAKQYNVNIIGDLTNDNGVLSGFSINDYATLPETLENLTINSLEIVFKFKTNSLTSNNAIFWTDKLIDDPEIPWAGIRLCNYNADGWVFDLEITNNNTQLADIYDTTAILPNKYYYIKILYHNTSGYKLYKSEDGENYTLVGTSAVTTIPSNSYALIGRAVDIDPMPLNGSIDLNESYIKVNGAMWWRGAESITKIQLRHDTAANWTSVNPILLEGEVGIETDTRKQKFGDGVTAWNSLPYDKGSTALQSITSSNVTNALGYTPVNKAGDTMSGNLNFTTSSSNPDIRQVTTLSDVTLGTLPSVTYFNGFQTKDNQGNEFANVNCSYSTNGRIGSNFYITRSDGESTVSGSMGIYIDQGGTEAYCTFPNTTCCDGQWTVIDTTIASSYSLASQATQYWTISDIPNDGNKYEVQGTITASGTNIAVVLISYLINKPNRIITTSGSSCVFTFPISSNRQIGLANFGTDTANINYFRVYGYRRIGTNA